MIKPDSQSYALFHLIYPQSSFQNMPGHLHVVMESTAHNIKSPLFSTPAAFKNTFPFTCFLVIARQLILFVLLLIKKSRPFHMSLVRQKLQRTIIRHRRQKSVLRYKNRPFVPFDAGRPNQRKASKFFFRFARCSSYSLSTSSMVM